MNELRIEIVDLIEQLGSEYRTAPASILTESDLQCLLISRLMRLDPFRGFRPTRDDGILGSMVHSEVSWFDEEGLLRLKPDITILEPSNLSILHGLNGARLPRKGFRFDGHAIIFELKLVRGRSGVTARSVDFIRRDLEKINELLQKVDREGAREELSSYFILFSKVDRRPQELCDLIDEHRTNDRLTIIYQSACVTWTRPLRRHRNDGYGGRRVPDFRGSVFDRNLTV